MTTPTTRGSGSRTRSRSRSSSSSQEVKETQKKKAKLSRNKQETNAELSNNNKDEPVIILPSAGSEEFHRVRTRSSSSGREVKVAQKKKTKLPRNRQQTNAQLNNNNNDPVIIQPSAGSAEVHNNNNEDPLIILHKVCSGEIHNNPVIMLPNPGSEEVHNNNDDNDPVIIPPCAGSEENNNNNCDPVIILPCAGSKEKNNNNNNNRDPVIIQPCAGSKEKNNNNNSDPVIIPPCAGSKETSNNNNSDPVIIRPCAGSEEVHNNNNSDPVIIPACAGSQEVHTNNSNNDPLIIPPCAGSEEVHHNESDDEVTYLQRILSGEFDSDSDRIDLDDPFVRSVFFGENPKNAPLPQTSREPVSERQKQRPWAWAVLSKVRLKAPLIHCMTSSVSMDLISDTLLACAASPAMVHSPEEIPDFTPQAHALYINVDSLAAGVSLLEMKSAAVFAAHYKKPWVLDPMRIGASQFRLRACLELLGLHPTVVKGNGCEIIALARASKALDIAQQPVDALAAAKSLALASGAIIAISGGVSTVTDGQRVASVYNGVPMMGRITSTGCSVAALVAAFVAVDPAYPFEATYSALSVFGIAGELGMRTAKGPASLRINLIDSLYWLDEATLRRHFKVNYSHSKA